MIYIKLIILLLSAYQVFSDSCCNKCCLSPNKKKTKEQKLKEIAEFKNKIFIPFAGDKYIKTNGYSMCFDSDNFMIINADETDIKKKDIYDKNINFLRTKLHKTPIKNHNEISIIVPVKDINTDLYEYGEETGYIHKIKDDGGVIYFFQKGKCDIVYVYLKGIRGKLCFNSKKIDRNDVKWKREGYTILEDGSNFDNNYIKLLDFSSNSAKWHVILANYVNKDYITLQFYDEK